MIQIDDEWLNPDGSQPKWLSEFIRCQKYLEDALEYNAGTYNIQDILDEVASGDLQLWTNKSSAFITQFVVYPRKKVLHIPFVGGNLEELSQMMPTVIDFAKQTKCDLISTAGRRGWERTFLRDYNFKFMHLAMQLEIEHG